MVLRSLLGEVRGGFLSLVHFVVVVLIFSVAIPVGPLSGVAFAATGIPKIINYQGRLMDVSGNLLGGSGTDYCVQFSLYDDSIVGGGDVQVWPSASPSTMTVVVKNGVFNAGIGDVSAGGDVLDFDFQSNDAVYLNVEVASKVGATCAPGDGAESFETLSPRQRITATGYAVNAETLKGFSPSQEASGNQIPVLSSGNLLLGGTNPILKASTTNTLTLQGSGSTGDLQFFSALNKITSQGNATFAGAVTAAGGSFTTATSGEFTVTGTASTSNLVVSNGFTFGTVSGILKSVAGVVSAALVNLSSDITGVLGISNGGTGTSTAPGLGELLVGNASGGYDLIATSSLGLAFSTTSTDYWRSQNNFFSTTSATYWETTQSRWATTSAAYNLSTFDKGYFFSTTSASNFASVGLAFSTTSSAYFLSQNTAAAFSTTSAAYNLGTYDKGYFFSTTSVAYWDTQQFRWATTSSDAWLATKSADDLAEGVTNTYYTNTKVNTFIAASTTIPKTFTTNVFSALQSFADVLFSNATTTNIAATGTASSSNLVASNSFTFGTATGILRAVAGAVSVGLLDLATQVTGILQVANGGTGWAAIQAGSLLYGNGSGSLATTTAGVPGQVLALLNGVPTWVSTSTYAYPLLNVGNNVSLAFGTTTSNTWSGVQTFGNTVTNNATTTSLFAATLSALNGTFGTLSATSSAILASTTAYGRLITGNIISTSTATSSFAGALLVGTTSSSYEVSIMGTATGATGATGTAIVAISNNDATLSSGNNVLRLNIRTPYATACTTGTTCPRFIEYFAGVGSGADTGGRGVGSLRLSTAGTGITQTSGSADFAEYMVLNSSAAVGDLVSLNSSGEYQKAVAGQSLIGVISDNPAFVGNANLEGTPNAYVVGFAGVIETSVSDVNGAINAGDLITAGAVPGVGVKLIESGYALGQALEAFPGPGSGTITVLVMPKYVDASVALQSYGGSSGGVTGYWDLASSTGVVSLASSTYSLSATNASFTNTTSTNSVFTGTASTSNLVISSGFTFGTVSGILKSVAGVVSSALVNLTTDITGVLGISNGGTGTSTAPVLGQLLVGNAVGGYDLIATSSLGITSAAWGNITGTLSAQTDLQNALDLKLGLSQWYATTTDALLEGATNKYFTANRVAGVIAGTTTDALAEGLTNKYYQDSRVQTYLDTLDTGVFFSTTSASNFLTQNQGNAFSTTSAAYYASQNVTPSFSTTSASYFSSLGLAFSTTSTDYWRSQNNFFSTTSATYWETTQSRWATTSAAYNLSTFDKGYFFSTTSASNFASVGLAFSTSSSAYYESTLGARGASSTLLSDANTFAGNTIFGQATSTSFFATTASSTNLSTTNFTLGGSSFISLLGTGLQNSGGLLTLNTGGDWTGTLGGYSAASLLANGFSTTSAAYNLSTIDKGYFFSTTSASNFLSNSQGAAFSTTSASAFLAQNQGAAFSTTSASVFAAAGLAFSTTSTDYWRSQNNFFSTTSATYWETTQSRWATTSAAYNLSTFDKGYFFSTTSASNFASVGLAFSTTSSTYFLSQNAAAAFSTTSAAYNLGTYDKGYFFSTTSVAYWDTQQFRWATTSSDAWFATKSTSNLAEGSNLYYTSARATSSVSALLAATTTDAIAEGINNKYYTDTQVNNYIAASTTIPKMFVANVFSALQTFTNALFTNATSTNLAATGTASSTNLVASNSFTFGTATGVLRATAGAVATGLLNLATDVTGFLAISNGGTGTSTAPLSGQLLVGNAEGGYDYRATSTLGIAIGDTTGTLSINRGGTGTTTSPTYGKILVGNNAGGYDYLATSSLGISPVWGNITGTLSAQTDLQNALDLKFGLSQWYATTTDALLEGATNKYYTDTKVNTYVAASSTIPKTYTANAFTALQTFTFASSTAFSALNGIYIGRTATTSIQGDATGTSTIQGFLNVAGTNSTSTFSGAVDVQRLRVSGAGTSTFTNGINLSGGCFAVNDTCIAGNGQPGNTGTLVNIQVFSTVGTTTYTPSAGATSAQVIVTAGGGGGGTGAAATNLGGSGGAGGTSVAFVDLTATSSVQVVVGMAGRSRIGVTLTGGTGGYSRFSTFATANGGAGGTGGSAGAGGLGGAAGTGSIALPGGDGSRGASITTSQAQLGGASYWGGGARAAATSTVYGAGGGNNISTASTGAGGTGVVVVYEYGPYTGVMGTTQGGLGTSTPGATGNVLSWNGTNWEGTATSSLGITGAFSTTSADYYAGASTTIAKSFTANVFSALQTFASAIFTSATTTAFSAQTASSTSIFSNVATIGSLVSGALTALGDSIFGNATSTTFFATTASSTNTTALQATSTKFASVFSNISFGTSTAWFATTASSSNQFASASTFGSSTIGVLTTIGTTTGAQGFNISGGCFAINGTCLTAGGSSASSTLFADFNTWTGTNTFNGNTTFGSATTTSIFATTASSTNFSTLNGTSTKFAAVFGNITFATSTSFFATTASTTNLFSNTATIGSLIAGSGAFSSTLSAGTTTATSIVSTNLSTSTFAGGVQTTGFNLTGSATSTAANGFNLIGGCFSINGSCIQTASSLLALNNTWTGTNTFGNTVTTNATTTAFSAVTASSTNLFSNTAAVGSLTAGSFTATGNTTLANATSTTSFTTTASSSNEFANASRFGSSTIGVLTTIGTTTGAQGFNISGGCFAINGTCLTAGGSSASSTLFADFNTWTGTNTFNGNTTFGNATSTTLFVTYASTTYATSTRFYSDVASTSRIFGAGLYNCNGSGSKITYNSATGQFLCETDQTGGGASFGWPFTPATSYGVSVQSTTTPLALVGGVYASSTSHFVNADFGGLVSTYATTTYASSTALTAQALFSTGATTTALSALHGNISFATTTSLFTTTASSTNLFSTTATFGTIAGAPTFSGVSIFSLGFLSQASSTIGGGTRTTGLTISGGATTTGDTYLAGNVGVGTTTPWARFGILANVTDTKLALFDVASSTGVATSSLFTILNTGNVGIGTSTPLANLSIVRNFGSRNSTIFSISSSTSALGSTQTGLFVVDALGGVGIGTSSPMAKLTVVTGNNGSEVNPAFIVATTSDWNTTGQHPIIYAIATTTGALDFARVAIGTSTQWGAAGVRDQLTVAGRIYSTWKYAACDFPAMSQTAALAALTPNFCGRFAFTITTAGNTVIPGTGQPSAFAQTIISTGVGGAGTGPGSSIRATMPFAPATTSPVMEVVAQTFTGSATTSTFLVGFHGEYSATPIVGREPDRFVGFVASTSNANWFAVVRNGTSRATPVDTGIASSSVVNGTSTPRRMRVELTPTVAYFLINGTVVAQVSTNIPSSDLTPHVSVASAIRTGGTVGNPGRAKLGVGQLRVWVDDPPGEFDTVSSGGGSTAEVADITFDWVSGSDISETYYSDDAESLRGRYGTLVIMSDATTSAARESSSAYDPRILGAVSASSRLVLGSEYDATIRVATKGKVMLRVTTQSGSIQIGDPITTSDTEGMGMKATRPGYIVGRALQSYNPDSGDGPCGFVDISGSSCAGEILVEVNPTFSMNIGSVAEATFGKVVDAMLADGGVKILESLATTTAQIGSSTSTSGDGSTPAETGAEQSFPGGLTALSIQLAASSTANGINLASGCYAIDGVCIGSVSSVGATDGTLIVSSSSGSVALGINLSNPNVWTGLQSFSNATTTLLESVKFYTQTIEATSTNTLALRVNVSSTAGLTFGSTSTPQVLAVDTINNRVTLGTGGALPSLLVLDNKNTEGDPTGTAGALYYNSNTSEFRCFNGNWMTCGGQAASSTGDVQFRNVDGSFAATSNFHWSQTDNRLTVRARLAQEESLLIVASSSGQKMFGVARDGALELTPLADRTETPVGQLDVYASEVAGRLAPGWSSAASAATAVQSAVWQKNIVTFTPQAAGGSWSGTVGVNGGSASIVLPTTTNFYTNQRRTRFSSVATTPDQSIGTRSEPLFFRGGVEGQGGFFMAARIGTDTWTEGNRLFVGLSAASSGVCAADATELANSFGFMVEAAGASVSLVHNDGTGTGTGESILNQPLLSSNQGYAIYLFAKANDTKMYWQIDDINAGKMIDSGVVTDNLPVATAMLAAHACASNGSNTDAQAAQLGISKIYVETDR